VKGRHGGGNSPSRLLSPNCDCKPSFTTPMRAEREGIECWNQHVSKAAIPDGPNEATLYLHRSRGIPPYLNRA
jgi:hypothetical protein